MSIGTAAKTLSKESFMKEVTNDVALALSLRYLKGNKRRLFLFPQKFKEWTFEQWSQIFWTDKSRITGGQATRFRASDNYVEKYGMSRFAQR